jgi:hypothetical protein
MTDHELRKAARSFAELFVADNGDPTLSVDDIDMIGLTHRYVELEAALATTEPGRASMANPDHDRGIEAAKKAFYRNMDPGLGVEEAISAYLATIEPGKPESGVLAEAVKPLEWGPYPSDTFCRASWFAAHPYGGYQIYERDTTGKGRVRYFTSPIAAQTEYGSLEEAKAAAQADYEQRIMSALSTPPQPEAQGDPDA